MKKTVMREKFQGNADVAVERDGSFLCLLSFSKESKCTLKTEQCRWKVCEASNRGQKKQSCGTNQNGESRSGEGKTMEPKLTTSVKSLHNSQGHA